MAPNNEWLWHPFLSLFTLNRFLVRTCWWSVLGGYNLHDGKNKRDWDSTKTSICLCFINIWCFFSWSSLTSWIIQDRGSTSTDRRRPVKQLLLRQSVFLDFSVPVLSIFEVGKCYYDCCVVVVHFSVAGWWIIFNIEAPLTNMNNKYWQRVMMMINVTWVFLLQSNGTRGRGVPASKLQHSVKLFNVAAW